MKPLQDNENSRCRIVAERESGYKQLKRHFQYLGYGVEDAKRMSNKLDNASWVYDNLEKICNNLKICPNVDIRRLILKGEVENSETSENIFQGFSSLSFPFCTIPKTDRR